MKLKAIIVPGNGCTNVKESNWYGHISKRLKQSRIFHKVLLKEMPDPHEAKENVWIPFLVNQLKADENTVIIGHSSGAVCCMRLMEKYKIFGCVLVSACYTDLGEESERISGYYSRPWLWDQIKKNSNFIIQYHSSDDPFIPREEADFIAKKLNSDYTLFHDRSHFFSNRDVKMLVGDLTAKISSINTTTNDDGNDDDSDNNNSDSDNDSDE